MNVIEDISIIWFLIVMFLVSMFFSGVYWLKQYLDSSDDPYTLKTALKTLTHSATGAIFGVISIIYIQEFLPDVSRLAAAGAAVLVAILIDTFIDILKRIGGNIQ